MTEASITMLEKKRREHMQVTLECVPLDIKTKDSAGLPWGMSLRPFANLEEEYVSDVHASLIQRCNSCFGYINAHVQVHSNKSSWTCNLCRHTNAFDTSSSNRYKRKGEALRSLPELSLPLVEYELNSSKDGDDATVGQTIIQNKDKRINSIKDIECEYPAYVFIVDISGSIDYIELIKTSLLAAIEALPNNVYVGVVIFAGKIGLFNLRSTIPYIKYVHIQTNDFKCVLPLKDVIPIDEFLVPLSQYKENICMAFESIISKEEKVSKCAFGPTLSSFLPYLSSNRDTRLICFLSKSPNYSILVDANKFQEDISTMCVEKGVGVDIFMVNDNNNNVNNNKKDKKLLRLKYLQSITNRTGGNILLYNSIYNCTLPQDLYRQLKNPIAFRCILRVRTSKNFSISTQDSDIMEDNIYENMYRISTCDSRRSIYIDFEFNTNNAFSKNSYEPVVVQMAFAYTTLAYKEGYSELVPVRRLRVHTRVFDVADTWATLYASVNPEVILTAITNKVIKESINNNIKEAKILLEDWLINLLVSYNSIIQRRDDNGNKIIIKDHQFTMEHIDTEFKGLKKLQMLPRYIYGLITHPLLQDTTNNDNRVYLQSLMTRLEPEYLLKMLYPSVHMFEDFDTIVDDKYVPLSINKIKSCENSIFLMDTFTHIYVYLLNRPENQALLYPPSHKTDIRMIIKEIQKNSPLLTPQVVYCQEGTPDGALFENRLIEDNMNNNTELSFDIFMEKLSKEVLIFLND